MKIGIIGAQSVGKTTLVTALKSEKRFKNYVFCDEIARRVHSYNIPINDEGTDVTQRLIMQEHITNVFMNRDMFTDRTALDCLVYGIYLSEKDKISSHTMSFLNKAFEKVWSQYDLVFYIKPEFDIVPDGVRCTNVTFRDEIDNLFREVIASRKLNVIDVSGSVRERVNTVMDTIDKHSPYHIELPINVYNGA